MSKKLVCYFSASGTTKKVAQKISNILESDLFEIEPSEKYTSNDLDWTNKESRSSIEMANDNSRPNIKERVTNINDYDTIIIGFPVWWYREPSIIDTFIEENSLDGKKVYIFITSGGSSVDSSLESLRNKYKNINFVAGKRFTSNVVKNEIIDWIN